MTCKQIYLYSLMEHWQLLPVQAKVYLGLIILKVYSKLPRSPEAKPHHQMLFSAIPRTPRSSCFYPSVEDTVSVFSDPAK